MLPLWTERPDVQLQRVRDRLAFVEREVSILRERAHHMALCAEHLESYCADLKVRRAVNCLLFRISL